MVELASRGDNRNVDQYTHDVFELEHFNEQDETMYKQMRTSTSALMYSFGKVLKPRGRIHNLKKTVSTQHKKLIVSCFPH